MSFLLQTILPYLLLYNYVALFVIAYFAALAFPVPSAATIMASAAFASQGYFNLFWIIIVASMGNIIGDNTGYWLARRYGRSILYRIGFKRVLDSLNFQSIEKQVKCRPALIVFFSRFQVWTTLSVNLISGLSKMRYVSYLFYEVLGEIIQVTMFAGLGYLFGANWQAMYDLVSTFFWILIIVLILLAVIFWKKLARKLK